MHTKQFYEAPEAELFEVRFEEGFLTLSDNVNTKNHTQYIVGGEDDDYEEL